MDRRVAVATGAGLLVALLMGVFVGHVLSRCPPPAPTVAAAAEQAAADARRWEAEADRLAARAAAAETEAARLGDEASRARTRWTSARSTTARTLAGQLHTLDDDSLAARATRELRRRLAAR